MANWFESNPLTSIVSYTILVAGSTSAAFLFVLNDNKVSLAKAESDQYKAKTEVLEVEIARLRQENKKYLDWMTSTPNTIPYLESKIASLTERLAKSSETSTNPSQPSSGLNASRIIYANSQIISVGETFWDKKTGASAGIGRITPEFTTTAVLTLPSGRTQEIDSVKAGANWRFDLEGKSYELQFDKIDWYSNKATISVREIEPGKP